jgi:hypothetical protein
MSGTTQSNPFFESEEVAVEASATPGLYEVNVFAADSEEPVYIRSYRKLDEANECARKLARVFRSWSTDDAQRTGADDIGRMGRDALIQYITERAELLPGGARYKADDGHMIFVLADTEDLRTFARSL